MRKPASIGVKENVMGVHPLDPGDAPITAAIRQMSSAAKGVSPGTEARGQYDALMESVLPRDDVTFEADAVGSIQGLWILPRGGRSSALSAQEQRAILCGYAEQLFPRLCPRLAARTPHA
jgi:monoterpene epsilon-lactone hydrolase